MRLKLDPHKLYVASLFAGKGDVRYYLNGVCIEKHPVEGAYLIGTNGHTLCALYDQTAIVEMDQQEIILPIESKIQTKLKHAKAETATFYGSQLHVLQENSSTPDIFVTSAIDGTFPNWRRVLPSEIDVNNSQEKLGVYNTDYLANFTLLSKVLGKFPRVRLFNPANENGPLVGVLPDWPQSLIVIMPMLAEDAVATLDLSWITESQSAAHAA